MNTNHLDTITRDPVCGMVVDPQAYLTAEDPVCGMDVNRTTARYMTKDAGERFYFCSAGCNEKFEASPDTYLA